MSFFFFKQKTAYEMRISDWSSDVCSSDLVQPVVEGDRVVAEEVLKAGRARDEGQQAVAEELAHAVGGVEVDIVGPADAERHAGIAPGLAVAGAAHGAPAVHAVDVGVPTGQEGGRRLYQPPPVVAPSRRERKRAVEGKMWAE